MVGALYALYPDMIADKAFLPLGKGTAKSEPKERGIGTLSRSRRANGHITMQTWEAKQVGDQKWTHGNKALKVCSLCPGL